MSESVEVKVTPTGEYCVVRLAKLLKPSKSRVTAEAAPEIDRSETKEICRIVMASSLYHGSTKIGMPYGKNIQLSDPFRDFVPNCANFPSYQQNMNANFS